MKHTFFSPAKVNLFFRVLRKRLDGYHEVASLFQAINLGDLLTAEWAEEDQLLIDHPTLKSDHTNLVIKALEVFRQKTAITTKVRFTLTKRIPMQSGLGGGSSNAATALW